MKKIYHLSYEFLGEPRHLQTDSLFEFYQALEGVIEDKYVIDNTISFLTEEAPTEPVMKSSNLFVVSEENQKREIEYQNFKRGR